MLRSWLRPAAAHAADHGDECEYAVRGDYALQADDGIGAGVVRRHDAGARGEPVGEREVQRRHGGGGVAGMVGADPLVRAGPPGPAACPANILLPLVRNRVNLIARLERVLETMEDDRV